LLVHPYTFRNESFFLPDSYNGDPLAEFKQFIELGVDGYFTDFPGTGEDARSTFITAPAVANLGRSQGFEGLAISPDKSTLYPLLEGTVVGDPAGSLRIYEFDMATKQYEGLVGYYKLENPAHAIGDFTVVNNNEYLIIERDNNQAGAAQFKKIFKVNLAETDANGFVAKTEIANLLDIKDPNDLNKDGSTTYTMPFQTIEDVLVIDAKTILVANDNNYPFSVGRPPAIDNNEIILLQLEQPLNLDPRVGLAGLNAISLNGANGQNTFAIAQGKTTIINDFGGIGRGLNVSDGALAELDTLQFTGAGFTAKNLLLNQVNGNLEITFEGVADTKVALINFALDNLDNLLLETGGSVNAGNILFDGQAQGQDSLDVFNAEWTNDRIFNRNTVTFLNDLDNNLEGLAGSNDVINGQGGDDDIRGLSGDDWLRGGAGNDFLDGGAGRDMVDGGAGNDWLRGGAGENVLRGGAGYDTFVLTEGGTQTIADFEDGVDLISLPAGLGFNRLSLLQGTELNANDTLIKRQGATLAVLSGVQASSLTTYDFISI
ncbi:MAG TPA: esterase-like activity of phytase family protein, partial [Candidatus Sericytochromatia bacterium]